MPSSDLPEDSVLRRHAESANANLRSSDAPPTDSVLRRHHDQMHGATDTTDVAAQTSSIDTNNVNKDDEMTASSSPIWKRLLWLAVLTLIGVIALYNWYTTKLKGNIASSENAVSESSQQLSAANQKLGLLADTEKSLRANTEELKGSLEGAKQQIAGLNSDMENLRTSHAAELAAEQQKAEQAYAQLQGEYDAANQQIATLNADIETAKQEHQSRLAEIQAKAQSDAQELEERMGARVEYFRTALEGSDPERAQQLTQLDGMISSVTGELDTARDSIGTLEAAKAELDQQLAAAQKDLEQKQQALEQAGVELADVQERLAQRQNALVDLQSQYESATAKASDDISGLQQELSVTKESHATAISEANALLQQTQATHTTQITEAEGKITTLSQELEAEQAALVALQEKHDTVVTELTTKLTATEQSLADTNDKLSTTIAAAAAAQESLESEIAAKKASIASLEQSIADERQEAAQTLMSTQEEHSDSMSFMRNMFTDLSTLGGKQTEAGMLMSLANSELRFRIGGATLPAQLPSLDKIAEFMAKYPKLSARIEGHTDNTGRDETNMDLSFQRASSVMNALSERGVSLERMTAEGIGANRPVASNNTPAGRRQNRRVEIYINEN